MNGFPTTNSEVRSSAIYRTFYATKEKLAQPNRRQSIIAIRLVVVRFIARSNITELIIYRKARNY